jgi:hypothetical protein
MISFIVFSSLAHEKICLTSHTIEITSQKEIEIFSTRVLLQHLAAGVSGDPIFPSFLATTLKAG